ncbi:MAG: elongation factor P maturation arginine rhamnosyltransferase EarP [Tolumonas sp.]|nr:elongation factor P maturation arginine rhamnosyltransferase EarP [Tolumonas sp.]
MPPITRPYWDVFCTVVDNYGDIGVTWRLARQLVNEYHVPVRLWVDDLVSFQRLCPRLDTQLAQQTIDNVLIGHWNAHFPIDMQPGKVVIEAFACELPLSLQHHMQQMDKPPVWLNLEYLTAESWIDSCHGLPSRQDQLTKFFFFPGFSAKSGGLLCENTLFAARQQWQQQSKQRQQFCQQRHLLPSQPNELFISLFSYENTALPALFNCWQSHPTPIRCLIPAGRTLNSLQTVLPAEVCQAGGRWQQGSLTVEVLPMTDQTGYDQLLWSCDINIVRGEDSFLRAQWAARPFLWHIYPQEEEAHLEKLQAFLARYTENMSPVLASTVQQLFLTFNQAHPEEFIASWTALQPYWSEWQQQAQQWPQTALAGGNLASQLVQFVEKQLECRA